MRGLNAVPSWMNAKLGCDGMKFRVLVFRMASLFLKSLVGCSSAVEIEESITMQQLPSTIKGFAEETIGEHEIVKVEKETRRGRVIYAINYLKEAWNGKSSMENQVKFSPINWNNLVCIKVHQ